jgi:predicted lipoprotein with Yx(FWY)xxD motif
VTTETRSLRPKHRLAVLALVAALAVVAIACSSSKKATTASTTTTAAGATSTTAGGTGTTTGAAGSTSVTVATTSLGPVVVDDKGFTLYFYKKDTGPTSTCSGTCATAWPPATVSGTATAGGGVTAPLTTTTGSDGKVQLVLGGHPLYRFSGDTKTGDVTGQGVGGVWSAAGADGQPVS